MSRFHIKLPAIYYLVLLFLGVGPLSTALLSSCTNSLGKTTRGDLKDNPTIVLGFDKSYSVAGYKKLDTNYVRSICKLVATTGGVIVVYGIGNPTDKSGIRCYITALPKMNNDLVLSKQVELKRKINAISAENEKQIRLFLAKIHSEIFADIDDRSNKINNTDINGFFKKVDVLLNEPTNQNMTQIVFCYSDGIQSLHNKDSPAQFLFSPHSHFILCLAGWKTKLPSEVIEIKKFEDPEGFQKFLASK